MNERWQQAESVLADAYQYQATAYTLALSLVESTLAGWKPGQDISPALRQIKNLMDEIAKSSAAIDSVQQQWLRSRQKPTPPLASTLQTLTNLILQLAARIQELEQLATSSRDKLAPELDTLLRARQMQRAYGAAIAAKYRE